jgi:hypothetical protein
MELLKRCPVDPEAGSELWDLKTIGTALETIKGLIGEKAYLVVRRKREAEAHRGERKGIISGGEEELAPKDAPTLFLYRQEPTKNGEIAIWWPQLRFPEGSKNYVLSFSINKNSNEEIETI